MPTNTFTPIATYNLPSAQSSYTFSSIPQSYTHLVLMLVGASTTGAYSLGVQFNGVTSSYYYGSSRITAFHNTTTPSFAWQSGQLISGFMYDGFGSTSRSGYTTMTFPFYTSTDKNKACLVKCTSTDFRETTVAMGGVNAATAISSITVSPAGGTTFVTGTTLTLFGILEA